MAWSDHDLPLRSAGLSNHISAIPNLLSVIGATPGALIVSIKVIKRAASGHTNPANRRLPTLLVAQRARRQLVCPMTPQPEIACLNCGGGEARNGNGPTCTATSACRWASRRGTSKRPANG